LRAPICHGQDARSQIAKWADVVKRAGIKVE
jgi:hypothetical protein